MITVMSNPRQYKIPDWFLNRQKDIKDGKYSQALSNVLDSKIRDDLERLKKIRAHRGLRHYWGSVICCLFSCLASSPVLCLFVFIFVLVVFVFYHCTFDSLMHVGEMLFHAIASYEKSW